MANFHTSVSEVTTSGEKLVYNLLDKYLDDEYHVWNNLNFGNEIDFFIVHHDLGIMLIEVKDWVISQLQNVNNHTVKGQLYGNKPTEEPNPLKKTRELGIEIKKKLQKLDPLVNKGGPYKNKLKVPINSATIFTNITTGELKERNFIGEAKFDRKSLITASDLEYAFEEDFIDLLYSKKEVAFASILTPDEIEFIIAELGTNSGVTDIVTHKLEGVLDGHQEKLATFKLDENLIIEGPAGSGKTIVLIKRLQNYLLRNPTHKVGIFSFNAVLANYLKTYIYQEIKDHDLVDVYYFDSFPANEKPEYNLILVDEAQDLQERHYEQINRLLHSEGNINLFFDKRQTIYSSSDIIGGFLRVGKKKFNEADLLLQKRSPILKTAVAYYEAIKNPEEPLERIVHKTDKITLRMFFSKKALTTALQWLSKKLNISLSNNEDAYAAMSKKRNEDIKLTLEPDLNATLDYVVEDIKQKMENSGANYHQFMVLHPMFYDKQEKLDFRQYVKRKFKQHQIPFELNDKRYGCEYDGREIRELEDNRSTFKFLHNKVRVFELFHCKGLDAEYVYVVDFDKIGEHSRNPALSVFHLREGEYVYVCLTRAKKEIKLFSRRRIYSHKKLEQIIEALNETNQYVNT